MTGVSVIPVTSTIHAETFAQALGCEVTLNPQSGAWAFFVGVGPQAAPFVEACKLRGIKTAAYWIGSDSLCAFTQPDYRARIPVFDKHICVHARIQNELAQWGVKAHVVWPCPRKVGETQKPGKYIGTYQPTPESEGDIYLFEQTVQIARQVDKPFLFYGAQTYPYLPSNAIDAGRLTPEEVSNLYGQFSCILRLCKHDGHPVGGIEAKMKGLHIVENYPYEGFLFADTPKSIIMLLNDPMTHENDKSEWPRFYRHVCSPQAFKRNVWQILNSP